MKGSLWYQQRTFHNDNQFLSFWKLHKKASSCNTFATEQKLILGKCLHKNNYSRIMKRFTTKPHQQQKQTWKQCSLASLSHFNLTWLSVQHLSLTHANFKAMYQSPVLQHIQTWQKLASVTFRSPTSHHLIVHNLHLPKQKPGARKLTNHHNIWTFNYVLDLKDY